MQEEELDVTNWENVVKLVQVAFWEGSLDEACARKAVVLISKGYGKEFTRMGLVEVLWKATTGIIKQRLTAKITYHGSLHGFWM